MQTIFPAFFRDAIVAIPRRNANMLFYFLTVTPVLRMKTPLLNIAPWISGQRALFFPSLVVSSQALHRRVWSQRMPIGQWLNGSARTRRLDFNFSLVWSLALKTVVGGNAGVRSTVIA